MFSPAAGDGKVFPAHHIQQAESRFGVFAVLADIAHLIGQVGEIGGGTNSVRPGKGLQENPIPLGGVILANKGGGQETEGTDHLVPFLVHHRLEGVGVLGEGDRVKQSLFAETADKLDAFLPFIGHIGDGKLVILGIQEIVPGIYPYIGVHHGFPEPCAGTGLDGDIAAQGGYFVGLAVAVGILGLEGNEHLFKLLSGLRRPNVQRIQPGLVHPKPGVAWIGNRFCILGNGVDMAVRRADVFQDIDALGLQHPFKALGKIVGGILVVVV